MPSLRRSIGLRAALTQCWRPNQRRPKRQDASYEDEEVTRSIRRRSILRELDR